MIQDEDGAIDKPVSVSYIEYRETHDHYEKQILFDIVLILVTVKCIADHTSRGAMGCKCESTFFPSSSLP